MVLYLYNASKKTNSVQNNIYIIAFLIVFLVSVVIFFIDRVVFVLDINR